MAIQPLDLNPERGKLRGFGLIGLVLLSALGAWVATGHGVAGARPEPESARTVAVVLWSCAGALGLAATVMPAALKPLWIALSVVTWPIGYVLSHILLAVIFFAVVTPLGLVMRGLGRDPMERRQRADIPSYWAERPPAGDPASYYRQY